MPESPEVQSLVEYLRQRVVGRVISAVDVLEFRALKTRTRPPETLVGEAIRDVTRYGKHLDLTVGGAHLGIALGRHGWARLRDVGAPPMEGAEIPPAVVVIAFADGAAIELTDAGTWVSIGLSVVDAPTEVDAVAKLGPDPADDSFTPGDLDRVVIGRRKQLKALLQEQESIAGIGNAYSDEILHLARLSPVGQASALTPEQRERLFAAVTSTIRSAIADRRGIPIAQLKSAKVAAMRVHGRAGQPCGVCDTEILDYSSGSTTAQYCPTCQTDGVLITR